MPILSGSLNPNEASVAAAPLADTVNINIKSVEWLSELSLILRISENHGNHIYYMLMILCNQKSVLSKIKLNYK